MRCYRLTTPYYNTRQYSPTSHLKSILFDLYSCNDVRLLYIFVAYMRSLSVSAPFQFLFVYTKSNFFKIRCNNVLGIVMKSDDPHHWWLEQSILMLVSYSLTKKQLNFYLMFLLKSSILSFLLLDEIFFYLVTSIIIKMIIYFIFFFFVIS